MAGKFRMKEFQGHMAAMQKCIDDFYASIEAQADDNEQPTGGSTAPAAATNSGTAQDSAPDVWARGVHGVKPKGLTHVPNTAATRALHNLPGYNRLSK